MSGLLLEFLLETFFELTHGGGVFKFHFLGEKSFGFLELLFEAHFFLVKLSLVALFTHLSIVFIIIFFGFLGTLLGRWSWFALDAVATAALLSVSQV